MLNKKIVVTGAGGFIGRKVVEALRASGDQVTAVHLPRAPQSFEPTPRDIAYWDAATSQPPRDIFDSADAVCHLAAFIPPNMTSPAFAEQCVQVNALGTLRLLEVIGERKMQFVHVSTAQLYRRKGVLAQEGDEVAISSRAPFYFGSKLLSEMFVDYMAGLTGMQTTTIRLGSVYGPGMKGGAIQTFLSRAKAGKPIEISADNPYEVDAVFLNDVVTGILAALQREAVGMFNLGSGVATGIEELARAAVRAAGAREDIIVLDHSRRETDLGFDALNIDRAKRQLAFVPTPLDEGLRKTAAHLP